MGFPVIKGASYALIHAKGLIKMADVFNLAVLEEKFQETICSQGFICICFKMRVIDFRNRE